MQPQKSTLGDVNLATPTSEVYEMIAKGSENFLGLLIDWRESQ